MNFDYLAFRAALGDRESGSGTGYGNKINYQAINPVSGAMGAFQFMPGTLAQVCRELNINYPSQAEFLNNESLQNECFTQYVDDNLRYIRNYNLLPFIGNTIIGQNNGIISNINIYGLVAGCWLGGIGNVNNYFQTGFDAYDGETYVTDYIALFSDIFKKKVQ